MIKKIFFLSTWLASACLSQIGLPLLFVFKNEIIGLEKIETNNATVFLKQTKRSKLNFFELKEKINKPTRIVFTSFITHLEDYRTKSSGWYQIISLNNFIRSFTWISARTNYFGVITLNSLLNSSSFPNVNRTNAILITENNTIRSPTANRTTADPIIGERVLATEQAKNSGGLPRTNESVSGSTDRIVGKKLFELNCNVCHKNKKNIILPEKNLEEDTLEANGMNNLNALIYQITNGKNGMPAFGNRLKKDEIESIATYVLENSHQNISNDLPN